MPDGREGGESISDPFFVEVLPFLDAGFTCDNLDDYNEACPSEGSLAPDVVYVYLPSQDHLLDVDLCGSAYDTKVYVYENLYTPGDPYACNDDHYVPGDPCGAWVSRISALPVFAGNQYFIVIDGWGGDCGDYVLSLAEVLPPPLFDLSFAQLTYGFEGDEDVETWYGGLALQGPVPVHPERVETHGFGGPVTVPEVDLSLSPWWLEHVPPLSIDVNSWIGCAPAACANSLKWLEDKHDEIDFPPELRELFEQLSNLMNRLQGEGAGPEQILKAKLDFIEAYDLPIHVKYQARNHEGNQSSSSGESEATDSDGESTEYPTRNWIESESAAGEDVELGVGFYYVYDDTLRRDGGHAVVVTGTATVNGVPKIYYKHDTHQENGTGQEQESSDIHEVGGDGGFIHLPGLDGWIRPAPGADPVRTVAVVEAAFSESYDPSVTGVPATHTFNGYCEWFKRTIPPGKKLKITFPGGYTRCENVTVYELDRTVDPPKLVKIAVWNMNNFLRREWVNTHDYPVTIAIHNDDTYEYQDEYVPYEIEVAIVDAEDGDETSPSNVEEYGGFSLGGVAGGDEAFSDAADPLITVNAGIGVSLGDVPRRLTTDDGTHELTLTYDIPVWNEFWGKLGVVIHLAEVASPGQLIVTNSATDDTITFDVDDTGDTLNNTGILVTQIVSGIAFTLTAANGLDLTFESVGFPSRTPIPTAVFPGEIPDAVVLEAARPNPFNPVTAIRFSLPAAGAAELSVYDVSGKLVARLVAADLPAGRHEVRWLGTDTQGRAVATGVYIYRLRAGETVLPRKMTLVR